MPSDDLLARRSVTRHELKRSAATVASALSPRRLGGLRRVRRALDREELILHYQPKVAADTRHVVGCEALVRWQHPERGLLAPAAFLPHLRGSPALAALTRRVLEIALRDMRLWRDEGVETRMQVNISAQDLVDPGVVGMIGRLLRECETPPRCLSLEVTEDDMLEDSDSASVNVGRLAEMGVRVSIDDFGTGYSSLCRLQTLPVDDVKIDRSFVAAMHTSRDSYRIVRAMIDLAHELGKDVVAEGVEDEATAEELAELGCDLLQGFHVARPMPADAMLRWLTRHQRLGKLLTPTPFVRK